MIWRTRLLLVALVVLVAASGAWAVGGHILTEGSDCLNAENADRLITEDVVSGDSCVSAGPACPKTLATLGAGC